MPTSPYMPSVKVEIAWDGGFRVPMADWTWTDVSDYVELGAGISGSWGRQDERSTADANTVTLTLDNSDGRFTAARVTSPYYPDVKLYKPIRVLADPVDGTEAPLFTGYVTSWPVEWEDTSAYAKTTITAVSRLARLGLNARLRSIIEETFLADSPVAYYPLSDPEGSTMAADASGNAAAPLVIIGDGNAVIFGQATGPSTDGLTAATFDGGQWLTRQGGANSSAAGVTLDAFFLTSTPPVTLLGIQPEAPLVSNVSLTVGLTVDGYAYAAAASTSATASTDLCDGAMHHLAATWDGVTLKLYVDGAVVATAAVAGTPETGGVLEVCETPSPLRQDDWYHGVLAHVAEYDAALDAARILAHAIAGFTAWAGDTTDARFERYGNLAGIDSAEMAAETGSTTMGHIDTAGQNIVDLLRITETTEAGVMFDALDGTLTLHGRGHRYDTAAVVTLDMAKHEVEADYSPRLDPSSLVNDITVTGVTTAHLKPTQAELDANGLATASLTTASENPDEPLNLASWARYQFAEPRPRVPSLSVDVTNQATFFAEGESTVSSADLLAATIGDRITVANHPQQAALSITDYFVEGGSFSIGPESFKITWNVSPTHAESNILILDDPVYGDFDLYALPL